MRLPEYDGVYPALYYVTSAGDEIPISTPAIDKYWELYGREGFNAPEIRTEQRQYADGSTRTLSAQLEPRDLSVKMVLNGKTTVERDRIYRDIAARLIRIGSFDDWGRLRVRRSDGKWVVINCLYTGGMNVSDDLPRIRQFQLDFHADDAYFYDEQETVLRSSTLSRLIYLNRGLFLGNWTLTGGLTNLTIDNDGEKCYPVIEVDGPASVIRVRNRTTGETLALDPSFSLLAGQTLTIDCREHRQAITLHSGDTESDMTHKLALGSSLDWALAKGSNVISLYYTDSADSSAYRLRYQRRYYSA